MDIIETIVTYETEKAYDVIDTITLSEGDTFKIESDGVEHIVLPVPSGKQHVIQVQIHVCESSV